MNIWLVTIGEPLPTDKNGRLLRAGVLAENLSKNGHTVTWWTSSFDHSAKLHRANEDKSIEINKNYSINLIKTLGYKKNISLKRILDHRIIAKKFKTLANQAEKPDIILCSYPTIELSQESVNYGINNDIPVLLDVRDLWPDIFNNSNSYIIKSIISLLLIPFKQKARYCFKKATGLLGVSPGYLEWGLSYASRKKSNMDMVIPLGYPNDSIVSTNKTPPALQELGINSSKNICWFIGSFGKTYDLDTVIDAAKILSEDGHQDILFVFSGDGENNDRWRSSSINTDNIIFTGWIGTESINWLRKNAKIGLQAYSKGAPQGYANKLFEYLSAGLPLLSSLEGENKELLDTYNCGLTYKCNDPRDASNKIIEILSEDNYQSMAENAYKLYKAKFSPKQLFNEMETHLEHIIRHYKQ